VTFTPPVVCAEALGAALAAPILGEWRRDTLFGLWKFDNHAGALALKKYV
jgi:hypothetical protein